VDVIRIFMDTMGDEMVRIANQRQGIVVVDTRGTLEDKSAWLNEIHPTSNGFKELAQIIFSEMTQRFPSLR
jgi:hypothetical protein